MQLSTIRKALVAAAGSALVIGTYVLNNFADVLPDKYATAIGLTISVLTPLLTYLVPNTAQQTAAPTNKHEAP